MDNKTTSLTDRGVHPVEPDVEKTNILPQVIDEVTTPEPDPMSDNMDLGHKLGTLETKIDQKLSWKGGWSIAAVAGGGLIAITAMVWFNFIEPRFADRHSALTSSVNSIEKDLKAVTEKINTEARSLEKLITHSLTNTQAIIRDVGKDMRTELQVVDDQADDHDTRINDLEGNVAKIDQLTQQVSRLEGALSQFRQQVKADVTSALGAYPSMFPGKFADVITQDNEAGTVLWIGGAEQVDDKFIAKLLGADWTSLGDSSQSGHSPDKEGVGVFIPKSK